MTGKDCSSPAPVVGNDAPPGVPQLEGEEDDGREEPGWPIAMTPMPEATPTSPAERYGVILTSIIRCARQAPGRPT